MEEFENNRAQSCKQSGLPFSGSFTAALSANRAAHGALKESMSEKWRRSVVAVGCAATLVANRSIRRPRLARSDVGGWGATRWQLARRSRAPLFFHWRSILYAKPQGNIPPLFLASPPPFSSTPNPPMQNLSMAPHGLEQVLLGFAKFTLIFFGTGVLLG